MNNTIYHIMTYDLEEFQLKYPKVFIYTSLILYAYLAYYLFLS